MSAFEAKIVEQLHILNETYSTLVSDSIAAFEAIDFTKHTLWLSVFCMFLSPLFWNVVARNEYRNKTMTKFFGTKELACYVFAAMVFTLGLIRDYVFILAIKDQPRGPAHFPLLATPEVVAFGYIISTIGAFFVIFSMTGLGIHGTYSGDHFGIIKKERVTGFPFNVVEHPMYYGSTLAFYGTAIWHCSPVGVCLATWTLACYQFFATCFEEDFTNKIYSNVENKKK